MPRRTRLGIGALAGLFAGVCAALGWARYATFHNETFDLAFYARMAWGLSRGDFWDPIVGANVAGLHLSPVLVPLGLLGRLLGTVPVLLVAQAGALAFAAFPLARIGQRRFGEAGALLGAAVWLLHPNLAHVATYEMHPGTLAVLPLAFAIEAVDRKSPRALVLSCAGVLACREDLALVTLLLCVPLLRCEDAALRRAARWIGGVSLAYFVVFVAVLHPLFAPPEGSLQLHFGRWGASIPEALLAMISRPGELLAHLGTAARLLYLPHLLLPLGLLPLLAPRSFLPALPILAVNLLSEWPTTIALESHYQTVALVPLAAGALEGAKVLTGRVDRRAVLGAGLLCALGAHLAWGGSPASLAFDPTPFAADARSAAAASIVARIPRDASVQAPYALMPHLAERERVGPAPPPERVTDFLVLDAWHRRAWAHREDLLRTHEEPTVRDWLARPDHALIAAEERYLLFERGGDPREGLGARALVGRADPASGRPLGACLSLLSARADGDSVVVELVARGPCPADLALRLGPGKAPERVDLLFEGHFSPAHLREGDRARSRHAVDPATLARLRAEGVSVGLLRSSGARPAPADPVSVTVPLERAPAR